MSLAGPAVAAASPSTWHAEEQQPRSATNTTRRVVQDKVSVFGPRPRNQLGSNSGAAAGNTQARNLATSATRKRWTSSDSIVIIAEDNEEGSSNDHSNDDKHRISMYDHSRSLSVGCFSGEQGEEEMLKWRGSNQEENQRLRTKAEELERLFAEHQRRVHGGKQETDSVSSGVRGSSYEEYMAKRDARRREGCRRNREEKEAAMRAMWESLERSSEELKAMAMPANCQLNSSSAPVEDEEDRQSSTDGTSKSINSRSFLSRSLSSSASRTSGAAVQRTSKPPSSRSLKSTIPNASIRKENTKPLAGISKASYPAAPTTVPRSRSTSSGLRYFEEKAPSSACSRRSSATPLTPLKPLEEQTGSKPFLKKGAGPSKLRTSVLPDLNEASEDFDASSGSPRGSASSCFSQEGARVRKKWETNQMPVLVSDSSHQPHRDSTKGIMRFLHIGKKTQSVSRSDYDMEVGRDLVSEQIRTSTVRQVDTYDGFSFVEGMSRHEQVQIPRRSAPSAGSFKPRNDHLSESSPKSPRSFFSLSNFRNKGVESKLR